MKLFLAGIVILATLSQAKDYGVYEYVIKKASGSFSENVKAIETAAVKHGWELAASFDAGTPDGCRFKAHVFILYDPEYAAKLLAANAQTGPFAVPDRINLFEDEDGIHVSVVNPNSINRTVLMDDTRFAGLSESHLKKLRAMIMEAVKGTESHAGYGQIRSTGFISKTMGVMAGGDFAGKIEDVSVTKGDFQTVAAALGKALSAPGPEWGLKKEFGIKLAENMILFGLSGRKMEAKSFDIVRSGGDDQRAEFSCPGLSHAAAYPFQILLVKEGADIKVRMVTAMFRMKIFFEDAGKIAFMKNMTMPGSLASEVQKMVEKAIPER